MGEVDGSLWEKIISWENLYEAFLSARRGKRRRTSTLVFSEFLEENLVDIQNRLIWKEWSPGFWREFYVHEPKKRLIQAPPFRDRVVHHALVGVIEPMFEKKFIKDSYACRKEKGTHAAVKRVQFFMRRVSAGSERPYVVKADISKYFPSIPRDRLLLEIEKTIKDKNVLWLCRKIIGAGGCGIPIGSLTSQLFANMYLDRLDHFAKDDCGYRHYVRYMDDWVIICENKQIAQKALWNTVCFVKDLGLEVNHKTGIYPMSHGVDFCGYRIWPGFILPRKRNVSRAKKRILAVAKKLGRGEIGNSHMIAVVASFRGYMKACSGFRKTNSVIYAAREAYKNERVPALYRKAKTGGKTPEIGNERAC